jgi:ATP-dependent DNA ligase
MPPVPPMLAKLARELPESQGLAYEPKWDGFRCIAFRDRDEVELGSRNERPLTRYFPELVEAFRRQVPERCVLDGEVVIVGPAGLDFDALLQRIHPADSRVRLLASSTPASFVAFDLLALGDKDLRRSPYGERRRMLEEALSAAAPPVHLTPVTLEASVARQWFSRFEGAGLDGVVAKRLDLTYREAERAMVKVKHERTADCVVGGFRWYKGGAGIGSLLLGLYDDEGSLHHVGVTASFRQSMRSELVERLEPYRPGRGEDHPWREHEQVARRPGTPSRWNSKKGLDWEPLRPELVCEVAYDHLQGDRFRHGTTFKRWRPDRSPRSCTYSQLEAVPPAELYDIFGSA